MTKACKVCELPFEAYVKQQICLPCADKIGLPRIIRTASDAAEDRIVRRETLRRARSMRWREYG